MTPLSPHLALFLREYLPRQRAMSAQTSDTYAYAFQLLLCFAAGRLQTTPSALSIEISPPLKAWGNSTWRNLSSSATLILAIAMSLRMPSPRAACYIKMAKLPIWIFR